MSYDFSQGDTFDLKFTTRSASTGPSALSGGAITVFKDNSTAGSTAGVTLSADFASITGLNNLRIATTADTTFYSNGSRFDAVLTAGTVNSVAVTGEIARSFTLRGQAALYPTTAGRTLTIESDGMAHADVKEVGGTTQTAGDIIADTNDIQSRLPAALVSGRMDSSVGAMAANTLTASALAADAVTEIQSGLSTLDAAGVRTAVGLASANLDTQLAPIANLPSAIKKNTALASFEFLMEDTSGVAVTGLTITATRSIDGAAFAACANSASEVSNGIYKIDLANTDLNGNVITFRFEGTGAKDRFITVLTKP